jgi:riboflavin synthase
MDFSIPEDVLGLTVKHGSITLNGVSLTVSELPAPGVCRIGVIPFTHEHTNLGILEAGDRINIEGDMIGKYVGRVLASRDD